MVPHHVVREASFFIDVLTRKTNLIPADLVDACDFSSVGRIDRLPLDAGVGLA
jgi:hypothetical protein